MIIYTSESIEKNINKKYRQELVNKQKELVNKQKELDEKQKRTGKINKYTAKVYINQPNRIFHIKDEEMFVEINGELVKINNQPCPKGGIYCTDPEFDEQLIEFIKSHPNYKITFNINSKYGATNCYCSGPNVYPSFIESNNKVLFMENENNYGIGC